MEDNVARQRRREEEGGRREGSMRLSGCGSGIRKIGHVGRMNVTKG